MRDTLLSAIDGVRNGTLAPEKAKAMAALAHQVNASLDVELRVMLAAKLQPTSIAQLTHDSEPTRSPTTHGFVERGNGVTRHHLAGDA